MKAVTWSTTQTIIFRIFWLIANRLFTLALAVWWLMMPRSWPESLWKLLRNLDNECSQGKSPVQLLIANNSTNDSDSHDNVDYNHHCDHIDMLLWSSDHLTITLTDYYSFEIVWPLHWHVVMIVRYEKAHYQVQKPIWCAVRHDALACHCLKILWETQLQ